MSIFGSIHLQHWYPNYQNLKYIYICTYFFWGGEDPPPEGSTTARKQRPHMQARASIVSPPLTHSGQKATGKKSCNKSPESE